HALERFHDLAVRESRLLHPVELPQLENSTSDHTGFSGGLPRQRPSGRCLTRYRLSFLFHRHIHGLYTS
ncbi:hypothetical protein, partial [Burkholderia thailandensis]|uniref:hypothetical protein n=1 Tax=Burkholderia thailandensis TaxID=57975 RepID=UPI0021C8F40D